MKKIIVLLCVLVLSFGLSSCKNNKEDSIIRVGTMAQPGEPILKFIENALKEKGYTLDIKLFSDFNTPNIALQEGSIDANLFQHEPFLLNYNETKNANLVTAAVLYDCVYGGYTKKGLTKVEDIKAGSVISIASDASNMKRCLKLLEVEGLITLNELPSNLAATDIDKYIKTNPLNLIIKPMETKFIAASLDDDNTAMGIVNATFAIAAGLSSSELICKEKDEEHVNANILACQEKDLKSDKIKALVDVLTEASTKAFIEETFKGTIIPYFVKRNA